MKSLSWQIGAACFATLSAAIIAGITWWFTWCGVWFAAGMVFAAWVTVLDHWNGVDEGGTR